MADFIGIGLGIIIGIGIGLFLGIMLKLQKPWSRLTVKEKNVRIILTIACILLLLAGIVTSLLFKK
jgi:ABC-type antimicrobial peptide transport system permease subunit